MLSDWIKKGQAGPLLNSALSCSNHDYKEVVSLSKKTLHFFILAFVGKYFNTLQKEILTIHTSSLFSFCLPLNWYPERFQVSSSSYKNAYHLVGHHLNGQSAQKKSWTYSRWGEHVHIQHLFKSYSGIVLSRCTFSNNIEENW